MLEQIEKDARSAIQELIRIAKLEQGDIVVIGCSSSEILGKTIGSCSSMEAAQAVFNGIYSVVQEKGIYLAAQCCEHLNRALIIEKEAVRKFMLEEVNVVPQPKAGGSFATVAYYAFNYPAAVEEVKVKAGIDIGNTLIGMHLVKVAIPVRLSIRNIGEANIVCARTRPKFIGGMRAAYNEALL